jgi:hypothetical protein
MAPETGSFAPDIDKTIVKTDFESVATMWNLGEKFKIVNVCITAIMWAIWKFRNDMMF